MGFLRDFALNIPSDRVLGRNPFALKKGGLLSLPFNKLLKRFGFSLVPRSPHVPFQWLGICFPDLRLCIHPTNKDYSRELLTRNRKLESLLVYWFYDQFIF